jgi:RNA polymerase sigma factor for flagellar operon FliA
MNHLLSRAIGELPPRKRQVLPLYYFEELTMKEDGERLGVGESRVSQIHTDALARLGVRMRQLLESRARQRQRKEVQGRTWNSPETGTDQAAI